MRILLSDSAYEEKSMLSLFSPRQISIVRKMEISSGGICACNEEGRYMAFFPGIIPEVSFAVRFDADKSTEYPNGLSDCGDSLIMSLVSAFERADHIGKSFSLFPDESLIEANMLLSEYIRVHTVKINRLAASFGFAVVGEGTLVTLLLMLIIFLGYILEGEDELDVEISNCDGIFKAEIFFKSGDLNDLVFTLPKICGADNVVIRCSDGKYSVDIIAAVEDDSKIGLKSSVD